MDPEKVKGTLEMHQSNPSGVCISCISGITNDAAKEGIFLQFSKKYPDLKIVVTSVEKSWKVKFHNPKWKVFEVVR